MGSNQWQQHESTLVKAWEYVGKNKACRSKIQYNINEEMYVSRHRHMMGNSASAIRKAKHEEYLLRRRRKLAGSVAEAETRFYRERR